MNDIVLFKKDGRDVTFEDLLRTIYDNHEEKKSNILATVKQLSPLIRTLNDAVIIMPSLSNLQEISIKNDDQLIKMAAIVQRMQNKKKNKDSDEDFLLSDIEKNEILRLAKNSIPNESK